MSSKPTAKKTAQLWLDRINLDDTTHFDLLNEDPSHLFTSDLGTILQQRYAALQRSYTFKPGDLVTWKPRLRNKTIPGEADPAIVLQVLEQPIFDEERNSASPYFREPLDLVLGVLCNIEPHRGEWMSFYYDSRLFQPWTPEVAE